MDFSFEETAALYHWHDLPTQDRPAERLNAHGAECLADADLLAVILQTGENETARNLLRRFDSSLRKIANATVQELQTVKGIGKVKANQLKAALALAGRLNRVEVPMKLDSPSIVAEYLHDIFQGKRQEEIRVILLDTRNQLIGNRLVTKGLLTTAQVHPREVFRPAIREAAARIIVAHNHPSGDPEPSKQDLAVTETLYKAGEAIGIPLVDHVVIGDKTTCDGPFFVSLRQRGLCG